MHYATIAQRGRALFIDSIWWTAILLFVPLGPPTDEISLSPDGFALSVMLSLFVGQCIPILITGVLWAVWGTSPGKRAVRLQIVDAESGQPMSTKQAVLRTVGYLLTFAMLGAGFAWVLFNPQRQALHDRVASTVVVTEAPANT
ncbi:RDD family protein [Caballeronia novacaledonica]|uniref:RDD family protein n=1 Tax=Caballeronia novacaledonica TaxID=1544861 RepID=UPI001EE223F9|nr:RDD family protein [Caballeronia novacaledonica]GJH14437.1 RDD family protein [Caballeronia novacaledonica]